MTIKNKIIKFYGNRKYIFDLAISVLIMLLLIIFGVDFSFVENIFKNLSESSISFLGIIVGFLLTTFSLLFLYDPKNSEKLRKIREMPVYKQMLSAFISTAFIIIIISLLALTFNILQLQITPLVEYIFFVLIVFPVLRVFKCIFYLYVIIELS